MNKKIVALPTMIAFVIFSISCTTINEERVSSVPKKNPKRIKVMQVVKNSGEAINFPEEEPGRIVGENVEGTHRVEEFVLNKDEVEATKRDSKGSILEITTKEGRTIQVVSGRRDEGKFYFTISRSGEYAPVLIPLSDVKDLLIKFKTIDSGRTLALFLLVLGIPALFVLAAMNSFSIGFSPI